MSFKGIILGFCVACVSLSSFAADQVVKEETTPPAAEGAITVDEIPPLISSNKPAVAPAPAAPATTTTTTTTTTGTNPPAPAPVGQ